MRLTSAWSMADTPQIDWRNPDYAPVFKSRHERLLRLRKEPGLLPGLEAYYRDRPADFIHDWCMTFDPRAVERGLPAVMPFLLFPRQREFIDWLHARWKGREDGACVKSRDMGVSWLCVAFGVWMMRFHPGTVVGFGSRKEEYVDKIGDPKSLFWKARELIKLLPREFRPAGWNESTDAPHLRILNRAAGSSIVGEAGDNIGRGNRTSIYFVDEAAFIERPEAVDAALSQTSNCKIHVSTPNGAGNPFYRKVHGGKIPVFVFDWRDDPRKDADWYAKQCETLDPVVVAQEIDRNFEASVTDAFMHAEPIREAMRRGPQQVQGIGPLQIGVDVARFGDDLSVITARKGRLVLPQETMQGYGVDQVAARVKAYIDGLGERPAQIAVDTIGIGAGVADILRQWYGAIVVDVNSAIRWNDGKCYNLRAFMWAQMRDWFDGPVSIPPDDALASELTALRYRFKGAEMLIEAKDEAKKRGIKSPDRADSLALTFAYPLPVAAPIKFKSWG
nr:MAG: terminase large subunit [Caudoviricetes sp.]